MRTSTRSGDLLIAATDVDDTQVDLRRHAGAGRILHYDRDYRLLGEWRTGRTGLVVGLALDPGDGNLYACDPGSQTISVFSPSAELLGLAPALPRARIGALLFTAAGRFVAGLHSRIGEDPAQPASRLYVGSLEPPACRGLAAAVDGGRQGFHCITHMALAADRRTLLYVSEGGRRIMRFDLQSEQQLPDFLGFAADDLRGTFGPAVLADGKVWMATGRGAECFGPDGQPICSVAPEIERGWSRLTLANDGASFFLGNFLAGILEQRSSADGQLLTSLDIRRRYSLSGVVQVP